MKELVTFATRYDFESDREAAVNRFLTDVALQSDQDELKEEKNAVRLMTVHASKGLEFEYVFVTGLEEGLFPHERLHEEHMDEGAMEEERRLFYVALTRAKKKVFLSYAGVRTIFGARQVTVPSEFIFDIDEELLAAEDTPPAGGEEGGKIIFFE
jgi:DNA helicase-2/ATP-dependent DNA helicase PcrA